MSKRATVIPLIVLVVAALLFFVINGRWTSWFGGRAKQETDDAYVQADMTPLSTHISGTVRKMKVEDFDSVKAGQVLAVGGRGDASVVEIDFGHGDCCPFGLQCPPCRVKP